jgi:preprotein translocase subunit SecB
MQKLDLKVTQVKSIEFHNNITSNTQIKLEHKYSFGMKYAPNGICVGEFSATISDKNNPDMLNLEIKYNGQFTYPPEMPKKDIHMTAYDMLFPYVRAYVATITAAGGMPPMTIPYIDISNQPLYHMDLGDRE